MCSVMTVSLNKKLSAVIKPREAFLIVYRFYMMVELRGPHLPLDTDQ